MRLFSCPACRLVVFFENVACERCAAALGYEPTLNKIVALSGPSKSERYRYCANQAHGACNWLVPADAPPGALCRACRHNVVIPDLTSPANLEAWRRIEVAKHGLIYTALRLGLPLADRVERPADGLGFQFLADTDPATKVLSGHADGLITIALAEADDAERERRRAQLREPYRTLVGHFRHEIGHYYWNCLVRDTPARERFTALFGDADQDYAAALARHYENGPPADWQQTLVSAYAAAHPWEDFAETWAHYLHIVDTLETGGSYRIALTPRLDHDEMLSTSLDFNVYAADLPLATLIDAWVALSTALNSFNRSMGLPDAYPFVLAPPVIEKLGFIHELVQSASAAKVPAVLEQVGALGRDLGPRERLHV